MGQAIVLPDPLDETATTTATASIASADDLLSQLAGEEIDRLLAESEAQRAAVEQASASPAFAPAPVAPAEIAVEGVPANGPADDVIAATLAAAPPPPPAPELVSALAPPPSPEPVAPPLQAAAGAHELVVSPAPIVAPDPEADATAAAERAALSAEAFASVRLPDEAPVEPSSVRPTVLPLYLRPLEWLSAPLEACPETLREVIGKVAIVTLVNALAVLAYVLLLRKH